MNGLFAYTLIGLIATALAPEMTEAVVPVWIWRAFVSILIVIVGYFLKKLLDDNKEINDKRDKKIEEQNEKISNLIKITTAHEVMYELWIDGLAGELQPDGGRRKSDRLAYIVKRLAEENQK